MPNDELYEIGSQTRTAMFGRPTPSEDCEKIQGFTEKIEDVITRVCFGDIWQRDGLDKKTRSLITVGMLVALGRPEELIAHLRGALNNGNTETEIRELMIHTFLYCGLPATMQGIRLAEKVLVESRTMKEESE